MNNQKTKTKIKNVLLTIIGVPMAIVMASEVQKPEYWWVQAVAAILVFIIITIALGGKNEWNQSRRG
ncbi:hypothetical protein IJH24_03500 [Candidatus Saccharibacteria bacterium]|nr:hypothetical protein [Candidatus Saccharibacteria bacterium]